MPESKLKPQEVLPHVWPPALLLQSGPISSGWAVKRSWSPCSGSQVPSGLFTGRTLPAQTQTKIVLFFPLSYSFQLSSDSEHSTRTPCTSQPAGTPGWLEAMLWIKGITADGQQSPRMRPAQGGLGISNLFLGSPARKLA